MSISDLLSVWLLDLTFLFSILIDWEFNTALTQDYIDVALPALQQHMMYGSARLAALIEDIYGDSNQEIFLQWFHLI